MTHQQIDIFRTLGPTMLPKLIDPDNLDSIDDYGDYALLTYNLPNPIPISEAMDDMEDNMDMNVHDPLRPLDKNGLYGHAPSERRQSPVRRFRVEQRRE